MPALNDRVAVLTGGATGIGPSAPATSTRTWAGTGDLPLRILTAPRALGSFVTSTSLLVDAG